MYFRQHVHLRKSTDKSYTNSVFVEVFWQDKTAEIEEATREDFLKLPFPKTRIKKIVRVPMPLLHTNTMAYGLISCFISCFGEEAA